MQKSRTPASGVHQQAAITQALAEAGGATAKTGRAAAATVEGDEGPAFPILDVFANHLHIKVTHGYALVNSGRLETFKIGSRRFVTRQAIARFLSNCIAASANESRDDRARRVSKAVAARARSGEVQGSS